MSSNVCLTCLHSQVQEIDTLLSMGRSPLSLHSEFGLKYDTVKRHKQKGHIRIPETNPIESAPSIEGDDSPVEQIRALIAQLKGMDQDKMGPNARATVSREIRLAVEALAKMAGPGSITKPDLATSDEWIALRELIYRALIPYPDALAAVRQAVEKVAKGE